MTDSQTLLGEHVRTGSEAAFRELVTRYVDLVYSTALRLVEGDTHRAEDVAQVVFLDLARAARTLSSEVMLGGWLHQHACFVAAKTMRGERRRQSRERQAVVMNALQDNSAANFSLLVPILDEAINELDEADRTAVLLRFFEQQDFRAVGKALGSNEDAARMRVTRALDKLQGLLKRRGVTTSAATLSVVLSSHAVQAAPVGLALTISTAAALDGTALVSTATAITTKAIVMTATQKVLVAAVLAAAIGTAIYEARQASTLRTKVQTLQQQTPIAGLIQQLTTERDENAQKLAAVRAENERLNLNTRELLRLRSEAGLLRAQTKSNDPRIGGKMLNEWLQDYDKAQGNLTLQAQNAIRQIGTNAGLARALESIGPTTTDAAPVLLKLLSHPDEGVRNSATNALKRIDPGAAALAGAK